MPWTAGRRLSPIKQRPEHASVRHCKAKADPAAARGPLTLQIIDQAHPDGPVKGLVSTPGCGGGGPSCRPMLASMRSLSEQALEDSLEPYITKEDIDAMLARRDLLVKFFESEITSKGEDSVLTDMPRKTPRVTIP